MTPSTQTPSTCPACRAALAPGTLVCPSCNTIVAAHSAPRTTSPLAIVLLISVIIALALYAGHLAYRVLVLRQF